MNHPDRQSMADADRANASAEASVTTFVLEVARSLFAYGMPAHRLETLLEAVVDRLGVPSQFFATPTAIFAAFGAPPEQRTYLVTPPSGEVDLGRLSDLDELVQEVAEGTVSPSEGSRRVQAMREAPPRYPAALRLLAHGLVAASAALVLGGRWQDAIAAALAGLVVGVLERLTSGRPSDERRALSPLMPALGAGCAAFVGGVATSISPHVSPSIVGVAGIIMWVPGLTLTIAMNEVATGHLVSGTSRISKALLAFLLLGFGAALGSRLALLVPGVGAGAAATEVVRWQVWAAVAAFVPCLVILLNARWTDIVYIAPACAVAFGVGAAGSSALGHELGAALATLMLGLMSNGFARVTQRPAAILLVPGVLLLVPGSLGFRSVSSFLDHEVLMAVATAFDVAIVAIALVTGLLIAALALPPRKAL